MELNQDIEKFIENFNQAWMTERYDELKEMIHLNAVFVAPDLKNRLEGRGNCIQSFKEYADHAKTHSFKLTETRISQWDKYSVAELEYEVEYETSAGIFKEQGNEIWSLLRKEDKWQLVWRSLVRNKPT